MNALKIAAALSAGMLLPACAFAQEALSLGDVHVVQQPKPAHYQPDSTDYDLADRGKRFEILCTVAGDGRMQDCTAQPNTLADQNFVRIGTENAKDFVIGAQARDGSPTMGRTLSLTCQFHPMDDGIHDAAVEQSSTDDSSSPPPADTPKRTDVAVNDAPY